MTTSTVLRTLQKKGLVKRHEHETDTRAKTVGITEIGIEIIKPAKSGRLKILINNFSLHSRNKRKVLIVNYKTT
jgi:DNA-binding MarR family transcriptional regulator